MSAGGCSVPFPRDRVAQTPAFPLFLAHRSAWVQMLHKLVVSVHNTSPLVPYPLCFYPFGALSLILHSW